MIEADHHHNECSRLVLYVFFPRTVIITSITHSRFECFIRGPELENVRCFT